MKHSLFLFIVFISICVVLTLFCASAYLLVNSCAHMAAGTHLGFFSFDMFIHGIIVCFPFVAGFSCIAMVFYLIRHPSTPLFSVVVYFVIGITVWAVLIPQVLSLEKLGLFKSTNIWTENQLTEGYFRPSEYGVYYYSEISSQNIAKGIYIDTSGLSGVEDGLQSFDNLQLSPVNSGFFADPLFANSSSITVVLEHIIQFADLVRKEVFTVLESDYVSYLSFASLGLALLSLISVKSMSTWKLLNLSFVIILYVAICRINVLIFSHPFFLRVLTFFQEKNSSMVSSLYNIQLYINLLISLFFLSGGLIQFFVQQIRKRSE